MKGQGLFNEFCRLRALHLGEKAHDSAWRNAGAIAGGAIHAAAAVTTAHGRAGPASAKMVNQR
jgi:hypothetical protein